MTRWILTILLLALVFSLGGCGEQKEDPYSTAMREAASGENFGGGDKFAVYDADKDRYVKDYLSQTLAETPEEVGAVLRVSAEGAMRNFVLTDAATGKTISRESFSKEMSSNTINNSRYLEGSVTVVENWAAERWNYYLVRRLYESEDGLLGDKLVLYDSETASVDYSSNYIPQKLRASSLEEIGAVVLIRKTGKGVQEKTTVTLRDSTKPTATTVAVSSDGNMSLSDISSWLQEEAPIYFRDREYTRLLALEQPGGGDKIIGCDAIGDSYTARHIPEELCAASPHETALIARMRWGKTKGYQNYSYYGSGFGITTVEFDLETVDIYLVDPATGKTVASTTITADYPLSVKKGTTHASASVRIAQIGEWLKPELESFLDAR